MPLVYLSLHARPMLLLLLIRCGREIWLCSARRIVAVGDMYSMCHHVCHIADLLILRKRRVVVGDMWLRNEEGRLWPCGMGDRAGGRAHTSSAQACKKGSPLAGVGGGHDDRVWNKRDRYDSAWEFVWRADVKVGYKWMIERISVKGRDGGRNGSSSGCCDGGRNVWLLLEVLRCFL